MHIRRLDKDADFESVVDLNRRGADYWELVGDLSSNRDKAEAVFNEVPPNCCVANAHQWGLFLNDQLLGISVLHFGFPEDGDAYLGLLLLDSKSRDQGYGRQLLKCAETDARARLAEKLYLAVAGVNTKGWAFWQSEGFHDTGVSGNNDAGVELHRLVKQL
ncbi:GNAT family N-acetyltransferase [Cochlodiniinecator piscidefendens]|uniref:GNAT family N-acetyltransferase n=1 Tax=Cochlodiniinecator piscidefendens TaxID=2715756 RepID=UPI0014084A5C|nr:GNAT family N-acetyltransferase [Cochlodiniinecator piscidefendens]